MLVCVLQSVRVAEQLVPARLLKYLNKSFGYAGNSRYFGILFPVYTGVAQLVEHWSPKPGVGSSSLSSRANLLVIL
jgi:hypothetical protein